MKASALLALQLLLIACTRFRRESSDQIEGADHNVNDVVARAEHKIRKLEHAVGAGANEVTAYAEERVHNAKDQAFAADIEPFKPRYSDNAPDTR